MGLTAGLWSSVSGLLVHGDKMNVIGNNLANLNTLAFKGQRMDFEDFMYANSYGASGLNQVGRGAAVGTIMGDFTQGPTESTTSATDLAIAGRGFFQVKVKGTDTAYYTRAGNFAFDKEGYLTDPHNYVLQGWRIDNATAPSLASGGVTPQTDVKSRVLGTGVPQDVRLDTWTVEPKQTTRITTQVNLSNNEGADKSKNSNNPFAALYNVWNGTQPPPNNNTPPIPQGAFSYSTTLKVYDESGAAHDITVYFDQVSPDSYQSGGSGEKVWEYIVTMPPSQDQRKYIDPVTGQVLDMKATKSAGMLMTGQLVFDSTGKLKTQTAYTFGGSDTPDLDPGNFMADPDNPDFILPAMDPTNLDNWKPAAVSNSGFPVFVANFTNVLDAQTSGSPKGDKYLIEMDFGLKISDYENPWTNNNSLGSLTQSSTVQNPFYVAGQSWRGPQNYTLSNRVENPNYTAGGTAPQYIYQNPNYSSSKPDSPKYLYDETRDIFATADIDAEFAAAAPSTLTPSYKYVGANDPASILDLQNPTNWESSTDGATWTGLVATDPSPFSFTKVMNSTNANLKAAEQTIRMAAPAPINSRDLAQISPPAYTQPNASMSYDGPSSTLYQAQDGYGFGNLVNYYVDRDGILSGVYSNGVTMPLFQIVLYDFVCNQGLRREGGNLFSQTRESGEPQSGPPGVSGLGNISANALEQSNVDMSREFVLMITTQRGFQANSKTVTTTDTMLETVIQMKR